MAHHPIFDVIREVLEYPESAPSQASDVIKAITQWANANPVDSLPWEEHTDILNGRGIFRHVEMTKKLELELTASQARDILRALWERNCARDLREKLVQLFNLDMRGEPVPALDEEEKIERQARDLIGGPDGCRSA